MLNNSVVGFYKPPRLIALKNLIAFSGIKNRLMVDISNSLLFISVTSIGSHQLFSTVVSNG